MGSMDGIELVKTIKATRSNKSKSDVYALYLVDPNGEEIILPESTLHMRRFYDGLFSSTELERSGLIEDTREYQARTGAPYADAAEYFAKNNDVTHIVIYDAFEDDDAATNLPVGVYINEEKV